MSLKISRISKCHKFHEKTTFSYLQSLCSICTKNSLSTNKSFSKLTNILQFSSTQIKRKWNKIKILLFLLLPFGRKCLFRWFCYYYYKRVLYKIHGVHHKIHTPFPDELVQFSSQWTFILKSSCKELADYTETSLSYFSTWVDNILKQAQ